MHIRKSIKIQVFLVWSTLAFISVKAVPAHAMSREDAKRYMQPITVTEEAPRWHTCSSGSYFLTFRPDRRKPEIRTVTIPLQLRNGVLQATYWADRRLEIETSKFVTCEPSYKMQTFRIHYEAPVGDPGGLMQAKGEVLDPRDEKSKWGELCEDSNPSLTVFDCDLEVPSDAQIGFNILTERLVTMEPALIFWGDRNYSDCRPQEEEEEPNGILRIGYE